MRRYQHPGKFEGCLLVDLLAYRLAAESTEIHSNEWLGDSASFVDGPFDQTSFGDNDEVEDENPELTDEEMEFLREQGAAIVYESSDGFVSVDWFSRLAEARVHFEDIAENYASSNEDENEDTVDEISLEYDRFVTIRLPNGKTISLGITNGEPGEQLPELDLMFSDNVSVNCFAKGLVPLGVVDDVKQIIIPIPG